MNRRQFHAFWESLRQAQGIAMRCVAAIPEGQLDSHPIPGMRSPKELVVHLYAGVVANIVAAVPKRAFDDVDEAKLLATIKTHADLVAFARTRWEAADRGARAITDEDLQGIVTTPWSVSFSGTVMFQILRDEFMHHRGQLYVYLRAMNVEPPMMWDFEHNDPEHRPRPSGAA